MTMIDAMLQQQVAQAVGWALVQFVWQGALVGVVTAVALASLRRSAADIRYVVSTSALALMLTLPVVSVVQSLRIERREAPRSHVRPGIPVLASVVEAPSFEASAADAQVGGAAVQAAPDPFMRWLPALLGVWLAGVAILTLRLLSGWLWVRRLTSHGAVPCGDRMIGMADRLTRQLRIARVIRILESSIVEVPTVVGWLKPVVLLPASALTGLTPQQLEAVLAHELAHIRRHDYLVNLVQTVVETLLFYHPAVWWLSRRIRIERENCCDDLAVNLCGNPLTYATALAELEGIRGRRDRLALAADGGSLLQRVRRLLGAPPHAGRAPGWLAAGLAVVVVVGISASTIGRDDERPARGSHAAVRASSGRHAAVVSPASEPLESSDAVGLTDASEVVEPPAPPDPPLPPMPPEWAGVAGELAAAEGRAMALVREQVARPISRETAARHCINWIRDGLPAQLRGHAHALRGACDLLASIRTVVEHQAEHLERLARQAASAAPAVVDATAEPLAEVVAAIKEASRAGAAELEPALKELARALEEAQKAVATTGGASTRSTRSDQKSGNFTWSNDKERLEVNFRGEIEFTEDDTDVTSLSPGGSLRIRHRPPSGSDREIEYTANSDGSIQRRYRVDRSERPFDPEGRKWAAEMLPRFIRQSGIGAGQRVDRIQGSQGTAGVFAEIALIEGSFAKRVYYQELLRLPSISSRDVQRALAGAGREVESDFELASLLISARQVVRDDQTWKTYFAAARSIDSDFELRRVLSAGLKTAPISPGQANALLETSASIGSDFEAASLLVELAEAQPIDGTTRDAFFRVVETVASPFERRRVLTTVLKRTDQAPDVLTAALDSSARVASDFECASILLQFVKAHPVEGPTRIPFFRAVDTIGSAFERRRVLQAVARRPGASNETVLSVIRAAQTLNGSFEKAEVLLAVARAHQLTREGRDAYLDASQNLGEFEQGRVLSALAKTR